MSKYINVKVSAIISTDFIIEVPDDSSSEKIKELAEKEVQFPHQYPSIIDNILKNMGIQIKGIDSMLKTWDTDDIKFIIDEN